MIHTLLPILSWDIRYKQTKKLLEFLFFELFITYNYSFFFISNLLPHFPSVPLFKHPNDQTTEKSRQKKRSSRTSQLDSYLHISANFEKISFSRCFFTLLLLQEEKSSILFLFPFFYLFFCFYLGREVGEEK